MFVFQVIAYRYKHTHHWYCFKLLFFLHSSVSALTINVTLYTLRQIPDQNTKKIYFLIQIDITLGVVTQTHTAAHTHIKFIVAQFAAFYVVIVGRKVVRTSSQSRSKYCKSRSVVLYGDLQDFVLGKVDLKGCF